jgi:pimeloyl-ACP methyl ester carboxylesterase
VLPESLTWDENEQVRWSRQGSGPPVVFCHGTPWSSWLWRRVAEALSADFTVYLWDMLGYGGSTMREGQDVSLARQGRLLAGLLERWELSDAHVVAHDFGGAVALRAHLLHGAPFHSIALVDVVALTPWGSPFFKLVADNAPVFAKLPQPLHRALLRAYIAGAAHHPLAEEDLGSLAAPWLSVAGQGAFYRQIAQAEERFTDEIEPMYRTISVPVLIAWGTEDEWIPVDRAHRLAQMIPGARLAVIPDAGHLVQLDAPERLTALLQRWLLSQEGAR